MRKKILTVATLATILIIGCFLYFRHQVYFSHGDHEGEKIFEIKKGEGNLDVSSRLSEEGLVKNKFYFFYYLQSHGFLGRIIPGEYKLSGNMTIPEVANAIANPEESFIKITFPEGSTMKDMAVILEKEGFNKDDFLRLAGDPDMFSEKYQFLRDGRIKTLEGYLFPDTYFLKKDNTPEQIINKILANFSDKITEVEREVAAEKKSLLDVIIMASITEKEVITAKDMKLVAGVFENRLEAGMLLQSDATLSYILDDNIDQHSNEQLATDSPYNTYRYKGLPPGPVASPGLVAIKAALNPEKSEYMYFLTVTKDGEKATVFSKTFDEHVENRKKYGL